MEPKTAGGGQQTKAGQQRETPLAILSLWFFSVPACPRTAAVAGSDLLQTAACTRSTQTSDSKVFNGFLSV